MLLLRYRGSEGMVAWAFHRISGIAIWLFVLLHVLDIYLAGGNPKVYDDILRLIFDSRDEGAAERLEILSDEDGGWRCRTIFNCVNACPRGINITRAILEVSSAINER